METILMGEFNLDYSQKDLNKHHLVKELKDFKIYPTYLKENGSIQMHDETAIN